jgi:hypothetical protein
MAGQFPHNTFVASHLFVFGRGVIFLWRLLWRCLDNKKAPQSTLGSLPNKDWGAFMATNIQHQKAKVKFFLIYFLSPATGSFPFAGKTRPCR